MLFVKGFNNERSDLPGWYNDANDPGRSAHEAGYQSIKKPGSGMIQYAR